MAVLTFLMQNEKAQQSLELITPDEPTQTYAPRLTPRASAKAIQAIADLQSAFHNKASRRWAIEDLVSAYGFTFENTPESTPNDTLDLQYSKHYVACLKVDRLFRRQNAAAAYLDLGAMKEAQQLDKPEKPASKKWWPRSSSTVKKQLKANVSPEQDYNPFIPAVLIALAQNCREHSIDKNADIDVHVVTATDQFSKTLRSYSAKFSAAQLEKSRGLHGARKNDALEISCREVPLSPASEAVNSLSKVFNGYRLAYGVQPSPRSVESEEESIHGSFEESSGESILESSDESVGGTFGESATDSSVDSIRNSLEDSIEDMIGGLMIGGPKKKETFWSVGATASGLCIIEASPEIPMVSGALGPLEV